jgi:hypothetical protein
MSTSIEFPVGTVVVVECRHPRPSYKGVIVEHLQPGSTEVYYKVEPDVSNEEVLWIAERRLKLAPAYEDTMDSWDMT